MTGVQTCALPISQLNVRTPSTLDTVNEVETYVAGLISNLEIKKTKRNTDYAVVTLDDGKNTFVFKSWITKPLYVVQKGDCAVMQIENSKYGWVLKRNTEVINLSQS